MLPGRKSGSRLSGLALPWIAVFVLGCAGDVELGLQVAKGFWAGFADGFLVVLKLVASVFADLSIYDRSNAQSLYHLGFYLGAVAFIGIGAIASRSS